VGLYPWINVANTFYWAAFPGIVRDLPKMIRSEQEVLNGTRRYVLSHTSTRAFPLIVLSPEVHAELDMLERSKACIRRLNLDEY